MKKIIIGIDPDCESSGVCTIHRVSPEDVEIRLTNKTFQQLIEMFMANNKNHNIVVAVECGWKNKSNWHHRRGMLQSEAAQIGERVGRNHETSRKIIETARFFGLDVVERAPLKKCWSGPDGKITHAEVNRLFTQVTDKRTNQEERDALLIAAIEAGIPLLMKKE